MDNESVISAARLLLSRGYSFCAYRFPQEKHIHLATEERLLPEASEVRIVVAPFVSASGAEKVYLPKVKSITREWTEKIEEEPEKEMIWGSLPLQTTREEYFTRIRAFLKDMQNGLLDKAILSRVMLIDKPEGFESFKFFKRLCEDYPNTYASIFYKPGEGIWIGATPEILLAKTGANFQTMALAGTQPRKEGEYKWREKELEEHDMVGRHIEQVFKDRGSACLEKHGPFTIEAARVAHLRTDYVFAAIENGNVEEVVSALHPTPAIGGLPVDKGVDCILKHEGYDRRYYCGYIGETNRVDYARLFINLRCLREGENQLAIFVGGGITASSNEEEEWNETVQKSLTMLEKLL